MKPLAEIVPRLVAAPSWGKRLKAIQLLSRWQEIVGEDLARFSRPRGFAKGALILEVADSVWMHQLRFEEARLLERLNQEAGEPLFTSLRLVLSRERSFFQQSTRVSPSLPKPNEKLLQRVSREVAHIQDPELREAFKRLRLTLLLKAQRAAQLRRCKPRPSLRR